MPTSKKHACAHKKLIERAQFVQEALAKQYPEPATHLVAENPWQLLIAVILSAQCTDARVNMVTPHLFARWSEPSHLAQACLDEVQEIIRSTGFFRNKAKNIVATAQRVTTHFQGLVPRTLPELISLPGVARKTANVVLWTAFGINEGIAVDTHVGRIAFRLGLTSSTKPLIIEKDLMALFDREHWGSVNHRLVWFGRDTCPARKPLCHACPLESICPKQ